jgi:hypothetical protein
MMKLKFLPEDLISLSPPLSGSVDEITPAKNLTVAGRRAYK